MVVELRNIPFDQQRDVLFWLLDRVPNFRKGAMDRGGNGAYLAEKATQRYGSRIVEVSFSRQWYELEMPPYIEGFADRTVLLARHEDVLRDHQALQYVDGIIRVPRNFRFKGSDGLDRHGDSAIAGALADFASREPWAEYAYRPVVQTPSDPTGGPDEDEAARGWWRPPLGAGLRGGI